MRNTIVFFAAEHRKSYWSGCIQAAKVICQLLISEFYFCASVIYVYSSWRRPTHRTSHAVMLAAVFDLNEGYAINDDA